METLELDGFLLVNKPSKVTSFGCVGQIRRLVGRQFKVGHAGTLDKFATGLLIIAISRNATKHLGQLLNMPKGYVGIGKLGELTDTYDPDGQIIQRNSKIVAKESLQQAILNFGKGYTQIPPVYSALKYQGQRLSDLHRDTLSIVRASDIAIAKARQIDLYNLELKAFTYPYFTIQAYVSSGTYIRSLINDLAVKVGSCATTVQLSRTKIGPFSIHQASDLNDLDLNLIKKNLITIQEMQSIVSSFVLNK